MTFESRIFKQEEVLFPEYLPEFLPHRENQIKQLARNLLPATQGRKPQNTFIFGPAGIGKTAVAKFVFREFEKYSGIKTVYINCWDYRTAQAILSKIVIELGFPVQRRGWAKDEIISRLVESLEKTKKALIVCLDEVDQLIFRSQEVLYDLLRINQYVKNPVGLIFISNDPYVFANLEQRIRSSLSIEEIEFKPYSLEEMKDILEERAKLAFFSVEKGVVLLAANHAVKKGGDVRVGLECLLKAGRIAERENANLVKVEHLKKVLKEVKRVKPRILKEKLNESEKEILKILEEEKRNFTSGELYRIYSSKAKNPASERSFRNYLNHLASIGLIKIRKAKGIRGKTRLISRA